MTERLQQLLNLLPEHIRSLPPSRLWVLLGLIGTVLTTGLVSLLWMSGGTEHRALYGQLSMEDAAAITAKLRELQVSFSLEGDGTTILVPADRVHDLRLRLATEGLPQGGGGFQSALIPFQSCEQWDYQFLYITVLLRPGHRPKRDP